MIKPKLRIKFHSYFTQIYAIFKCKNNQPVCCCWSTSISGSVAHLSMSDSSTRSASDDPVVFSWPGAIIFFAIKCANRASRAFSTSSLLAPIHTLSNYQKVSHKSTKGHYHAEQRPWVLLPDANCHTDWERNVCVDVNRLPKYRVANTFVLKNSKIEKERESHLRLYLIMTPCTARTRQHCRHLIEQFRCDWHITSTRGADEMITRRLLFTSRMHHFGAFSLKECKYNTIRSIKIVNLKFGMFRYIFGA